MSKKPNILVILTDDQGYGDLSRCGNTNLSTPNIDLLASNGATLNNFYVQPLCAPTRAEFLTGRYFARTGVRGVSRQGERIDLKEKTIADVFKENGYHTGCFGKWHSGLQYPYHPNGRGFNDFIGYCCGHWSHYFDSTIERNGQEYTTEGYLTDTLTNEAIRFIKDHKDSPFFCYVPLNTPHAPFQVPDKFFEPFRNKKLDLKATNPDEEDIMITKSALAMCENIDYNVGRIMATLAKLDLMEDTIIVYFSDNGPNSHRFNAGLCGKKSDVEEGGVKSPCSITWANHIPNNILVDEISGCIDLLPTLTSLAKINPILPYPIDGLDISPLLSGSKTCYPNRHIIAQRTTYSNELSTISIRSNTYRAGGSLGGLYNIALDPGQEEDISHLHPSIMNQLTKTMETYKKSIPNITIDPIIPVGYSEFPYTDLPVQDATLHGHLTYSSIHPNASYVINWASVDDCITWDIDVQKTGIYQVELKYTCSEESVGTQLSLTSNESLVKNSINTWYESEVLDKSDRVPREESYEKKFYTFNFGQLELSTGKKTLTLKAEHLSGPKVCDLRGIRLLLLES